MCKKEGKWRRKGEKKEGEANMLVLSCMSKI